MPASRILRLARTRRCAMVASGTRNARATAGVSRPPTVRSVSATCASRLSAGWQQVKSSGRRSSAAIGPPSRSVHPSGLPRSRAERAGPDSAPGDAAGRRPGGGPPSSATRRGCSGSLRSASAPGPTRPRPAPAPRPRPSRRGCAPAPRSVGSAPRGGRPPVTRRRSAAQARSVSRGSPRPGESP